MTDGWDERTEAIPGTKGDKSFELELEFGQDPASLQPDGSLGGGGGLDATEMVNRPAVVVFEPTPIGLSEALMQLGLAVSVGTTGVDVMSIVAQKPPALVVCAPSPDAERRRLLAAALRLRFPSVPVVYVSTHARQEEAVLGAIREGARAVLAWPLPSASDVGRVLGPYLRMTSAQEETQALPRPSVPQPFQRAEPPPTIPMPTLAPPPPPGPRPWERARVASTASPAPVLDEPTTDPHPAATPPPPGRRVGSRQVITDDDALGPESLSSRDLHSVDEESFDDARTQVTGPPPVGAIAAARAKPSSAAAAAAANIASARIALNAAGAPNVASARNAPSSPTAQPARSGASGTMRSAAPAGRDDGRLPSDALKPLPVPIPVPLPVPASGASLMAQPLDDESNDHGFNRESSEPTTQPNLRPAAGAMLEALNERRGEIGQLLAAVSPFLWSLEDAARWAEALGETDATAKNHARTLHLLAKILAQLQARIDEMGA